MVDPAFSVLDASVLKDRDKWLRLWRSWPGREVAAHPSYVELFLNEGERALAATYHSEAFGSVLYPVVLRPVGVAGGETPYTDIVTPYGYGGPFWWGEGDKSVLAEEFWDRFDAWASDAAVVSQFARLSLFEDSLLPFRGSRVFRRNNYVVDLSIGQEALWKSFAPKVRNNVRRALREGVTVEVDEAASDFEQFERIYAETMQRRRACEKYLFPTGFFESIHNGLPGQFAYFHARLHGRIVSTELVLLSANTVHSFLGGTLSEAFPARPNDLLKYEAMLWGADQDKDSLVLGGGYSAGDGIERFKKAFAPAGVVPFYTGHRVQDEGAYDVLTKDLKDPDPTFFPLYRAPAN